MSKEVVEIQITSLLEIPLAYGHAIKAYQELAQTDDIWKASITLLRIDFQNNFRRTEYKCVFEVTED